MKRRFRLTRLSFLAGSLLLLSAALHPGAVWAEDPGTPEAPGLEETGFPDMEADFYITAFDPSGHVGTTKTRVIRSGKKIRYQGEENTYEDWIIDYDKLEEYRLYTKDKIYFIKPVGERFQEKAALEGFFPYRSPKNFKTVRMPIRKEILEGHPCEFILIIQSHKKDKTLGQSFVFLWEALDLERQPLKIAFYERNLTLKVLEFKDIKTGAIDPSLLEPPEGFMSMTPY